MKKRRSRGPGDSLDLLLDTICNSFGGIIFIACLVAILARDTPTAPASAMAAADASMLERRIRVAEDDLQQLEALASEQAERADHASSLAQKRGELKAAIASLRAEAKPSTAAQPDKASPEALRALRAANREQSAQLESLLNEIASSEQELSRLAGRASQLRERTAAAASARREMLRFPKERRSEKSPFWVILKHGRVYTVRTEAGDLNQTDLVWTKRDGGTAELTPIPNAGKQLPDRKDELAAILRSVSAARQYVTVCLYPDSFDTWRELRGLIQNSSLEYGLRFFEPGDGLVMGAGSPPPPPL
jgi:small-conductance mechanosensitive channel